MSRPGLCALVNLKDRTWCWLHKNWLAFLILVLEGLGLGPKQIRSCKLNTENHSCPKISSWPLNAFHHPKQLSSFQTGACKEWKVFASNSSKSISKTDTHAHSVLVAASFAVFRGQSWQNTSPISDVPGQRRPLQMNLCVKRGSLLLAVT